MCAPLLEAPLYGDVKLFVICKSVTVVYTPERSVGAKVNVPPL
jgi:hypothetical protein